MSVTSHVLNNATNIDKAYAAMGLPNPSAAELGFLLAEDTAQNDDVVVQDIIADPNVQNIVLPVLEMFTLAFGHAPTQATLAAIISNNITVTAGQPSLNLTSIATAFIESSTFASLYNGGVNITNVNAPVSSTIVTDLFINGLGHPPSASTLAGFNGLTILQAFQAFVQSSVTSIPSVVASVDSYLTGVIDIAAGVPANAPPPPPTQSFTLTVGQDSVVSGVNTIGTTAPGTLVQSSGNVTVNAPLTGVFGNQASLTNGDVIQLQGLGNSLNATFNGNSNVTGLTIQGAQAWTINEAVAGTVSLQGVPGSIDGVTSLTYNGNGVGASNLFVGAVGAGIDATTPASGFTLNLSNVPSNTAVGIVSVVFAPTAFHGGDTITVNAKAVTNIGTLTNATQPAALFVEVGSGGSAGFTNWVVNSSAGNAVNDIALSALGSTAARTLTVTDDAASEQTVLWAVTGSAGDWAGLMTINLLNTTGTVTVTGGESANGLLSAIGTGLTTVQGGSGADSFDLSAYHGTAAQVAGLSINGGGNAGTVVELSNAEITTTISGVASGAFAQWTGVPTLWDVASGAIPSVGGTFNMADFPGTTTVSLRSSTSGLDPDQTSNIVVKAAPDGLNFDFNQTNQHAHAFSATGSDTAGGAGNILNVNYMDVVGSDFFSSTFATANFDHVNVNLNGAASAGTETFYGGGTTAIANTDSFETLTINASLNHGGGETILVGNITSQVLGADDITLLGGAVVVHPPTAMFSLTGTLDITGTDNVTIGITNASTITSTTSGVFDMTSPDDINTGTLWVDQQSVIVSSNSAGSTLQGTLGAGALPGTGTDMLSDLLGHSNFYGDGGADNIMIGGGSNNIHFGEYLLNDNHTILTIEPSSGHADLGFWGASSNGQAIAGSAGAIFGTAPFGGTSADMTTVTGFTLGATGDSVTFKVGAWGGGLVDPLTQGTISPVPTDAGGDAFALAFAGEALSGGTSGLIRVILDEIAPFTNAAELAHSLVTSTVGDFNFSSNVGHNVTLDFLVAYDAVGGGVNIADVEVQNTGTATKDTANMHVYASDMVHLSGAFDLTALGINAGEIHFA